MTQERKIELTKLVQDSMGICEIMGYTKQNVASFILNNIKYNTGAKKFNNEEVNFIKNEADRINNISDVNFSNPVTGGTINDATATVNAGVSGVGVGSMEKDPNKADTTNVIKEQNIESEFAPKTKAKPTGGFSFAKSFEFDKETGDFKFVLPKQEEIVEIAEAIGAHPEKVVRAAVGSGVKQVGAMAQKALEKKLCVFDDNPKGQALNQHMSNMIGCLFNWMK